MKKPFRFKYFTVDDSNCAMKIGTDSIMLGSWVKVKSPSTILDIGAGSGLLTLMLAQKYPNAAITAIEIEEKAAKQCDENLMNSGFGNQFTVINDDFLKMNFKNKFEVIISNPPYFDEGVQSKKEERNLARKNENLPLDLLIKKSLLLLTAQGKIELILPCNQEEKVILLLASTEFTISRKCDVHSSKAKPIKLVMLEISREKMKKNETLYIYNDTNSYTKKFKELTHEFYLSL